MKIINNKKILLLTFLILIILLYIIPTFAQPDTPIGLQKIFDFNKQNASDFAVKVSFFIAFIAGILGVLSPCILPFFPAYFSYTFKEKKNITKMTIVFFFGFSCIFVAMGAVAGFTGQQFLTVLQKSWLVTLAGLFLITLGVMSLLGKGFSSFVKLNHKFKNDVPGTFLFGMSFAAGWTACLGPILAGILGIGAILHNIWYSALLLFFYSLGNIAPLFFLSIFYDTFNLSQSRLVQGKLFTFFIGGKKFYVHSTNIISGVLFLIIGASLIIYKGTSIVNTWDIFGTKAYFYLFQNKLLAWDYANILGVIAFFSFITIVGIFLFKHKAGINEKE